MGRLALPGRRRKYQIQELQAVHKEICRRTTLGQKGVEIAEDLGISPVVVSYVKNSDLGHDKLDQLEEARDADTVSVAKHIKSLAPLALGVIEAMLRDPNCMSQTKLRAAQDLLDRGGHAAVTKIQSTNLSVNVTAEALAEIKQRARESGVMVETSAGSVEVRNNERS